MVPNKVGDRMARTSKKPRPFSDVSFSCYSLRSIVQKGRGEPPTNSGFTPSYKPNGSIRTSFRRKGSPPLVKGLLVGTINVARVRLNFGTGEAGSGDSRSLAKSLL